MGDVTLLRRDMADSGTELVIDPPKQWFPPSSQSPIRRHERRLTTRYLSSVTTRARVILSVMPLYSSTAVVILPRRPLHPVHPL